MGSLPLVGLGWWDTGALACSSREFVLNGALFCVTWMCSGWVFVSVVIGALLQRIVGTKGCARADRMRSISTGQYLERCLSHGRSELWVFFGVTGSISVVPVSRGVKGVGLHDFLGYVVIGMKGASDIFAQSVMEGVFLPSCIHFIDRWCLFVLIPM